MIPFIWETYLNIGVIKDDIPSMAPSQRPKGRVTCADLYKSTILACAGNAVLAQQTIDLRDTRL